MGDVAMRAVVLCVCLVLGVCVARKDDAAGPNDFVMAERGKVAPTPASS